MYWTHNYVLVLSLTVIIHFGMISRLSSLTVRASFLCRYCSSPHTPKSLSTLQNRRYSLYLFWSLAGWGPQAPLKKDGGRSITHGEHKQCRQWFSPRRIGTRTLSLYPCGCWWNVSTRITEIKPFVSGFTCQVYNQYLVYQVVPLGTVKVEDHWSLWTPT